MGTYRLKIKERQRIREIAIVAPSDFATEPAEEIAPEELAADPKFSLYCFDPTSDSAIFVELDDPAAVDRAAFYYQAQVEHAVGLVSMPMETFHRMAQDIDEPSGGIIFIHSVGRCGSTLLSKVLAAVPSVHSLSEPDDLTQLLFLGTPGGTVDDWIHAAFQSSVRWRCKPRLGPPARHVAIKTRSEVLVLADAIGRGFPDAKHFFLYRDGLNWMKTIFRGFSPDRDMYDVEKNRGMEETWLQTLPLVREHYRRDAPMNPVQIRTWGWITCMEAYLALVEMAVPTSSSRYEDLVTDPVGTLKRFFRFCKIDGVDWDRIHEVLARDSQAGTIYDREERKKLTLEMTPGLIQDVYDLVASRPKLLSPHVVLETTGEVGGG